MRIDETSNLVTAVELTGIESPTAALRAIYTDAEMMARWLRAPRTLRDCLVRANRCLYVSERPEGRYGLTEVPAAVRETVGRFAEALWNGVAPIREAVVEARRQGFAWDETWSTIARMFPGSGFGSGDAALLGVAS